MTERTYKSLIKIREYSMKIASYTYGYCFADFKEDSKTLEAVVFNLSQIGELVGLVDDDIKNTFTDIDWQGMKGLRNRIVHDYEGIKPKIIWSIITDELQNLIDNINFILKEI